MNPIKNPETENFCQQVAKTYKVDKTQANQMFIEFIQENKLVKWVQLAMQERIRFLIK